ncbi:glycosyltransferase family 2 protein [Nodosilinea sp. LEGE 07088]|uniref:glycosyltransferase family 2 protein n=1 Tax=Nodosilinea sp. LEGE 07088 TaxID=2777968 RepID=UPI0018818844|nr:glycosyltransferase family 2 protein [Nodosilinea sp. LEGE 07088]MBE9138517.1 glycosyltransferase family 2 protein [Nodosilinea sp. LEGE 07088]
MTEASTELSIIIPVYNGGLAFRQCLASIRQSERPPNELIVVADGDTDGSWQVAKDFGAQVIRLPVAGGPARARNLGAQAAKGDILFFMDADVTLHTDTLTLVEQRFRQQESLAALIGSYDDAPGAENFLSQYKNLFHHYTHQTSTPVASTFWGACGAIRRTVFQQVGGFDETYRKPCIEDIELGYRLRQEGHTIALCKDIQVKHLKRWEPVSLLRAEIFYRALPWAELILRDRTLNADLNLNHTNRASVFLVFALLGCLVATIWLPTAWGIVLALALTLLIINRAVYRFFYRKRGALFALRVVPWHWFYFLYGGGAFAYSTIKYSLRSLLLREPANVLKPRG